MQRLWLFSFLMLACTVQAASSQCAGDVCWTVTPLVCVTAEQEQQCHTDITVNWSSDRATDLCLVLAGQTQLCWQQATAGQWHKALNWQGSVLSLQNMEQQVVLQTQLSVLSRQPARRRRVAAPWSIF